MRGPINNFSKRIRAFIWLMATSTTAAWLAFAAPVKIELPRETETFKPGNGFEIANAHCLICHSADYVAIQPPLSRAFWKSSVQKMQQKYGATIPEEQVEPLIEYLTRNYGTTTNGSSTSNISAQTPPPSSSTSHVQKSDAIQIATKYGCLACHNVNTKVVGPAYREIAAKYRADPKAPASIDQQIHQGGSGKWGPMLMPPFPQVTAGETKLLTEWILSLK